jgi:hypothetical protein
MGIMLLITVAIAIAAIFFVAKFNHFRHFKEKFLIILLILFFLFIIVTFINVAHKNSIEVNSFGNFFTSLQLYFSWLGHVLGNIGTLTGNAVRMDWMSSNSTG